MIRRPSLISRHCANASPQVVVQWDPPATPVFCRGIMELDIWRDVPTRIDDHRPRQVRDFPGAEPCFD